MERCLDPDRPKNGNPLVKWRITKTSYIKEFVHNLPKEEMSENDFRAKVKTLHNGAFLRTAYQLYCQLALYYISDDGRFHPRFNRDLTDEEAERYFSLWVKRYYVPNPYTRQGFDKLEKPIVVVPSFVEYLKNCAGKTSDFVKMCNDVFKEDVDNVDALKSTLINANAPFHFDENQITLAPNCEDFMEVDISRDDKKAFFDFIGEMPERKKEEAFKFSPAQTIYYGVPGCGKSKRINDEIDEKLSGYSDKEFHKVRCVFHPEYGNADFVGQIYPYVPVDGGVDYRFKPGPFAEIVRRAYRHPSEPFFLIIEEINRGNAAAIFGEMFQLLDRLRPGEPSDGFSENVYSEGWSAYGVDNADVNAYIRMNSNADADSRTYDEKVLYGERVGLSANTAIRLPPNLSVFATMNTSDQNVFSLDNAFLRRFKLKMIRNDLKDAPSQYDLQIGDTGIRWGNFWKWINDKILLRENGISRAEDKCLGGWFIVGKPGENFPKDEFAEKVLKYLWDDVFKRGAADAVFRTNKIKSLSKLIEAFENANGFGAFEEVFDLSEEDKSTLRGDESVSNDTSVSNDDG